jgi:lycopene cyclase domain-containing protein
MFEYLIILIVLLLVALVLEKTYHIHLYHNRKERLEITGLFFVIGVVWDTFAIWRGHWVFPSGNNIGIVIGLMPLEEYLFALIIPYFILTIYKIIDSKFRGRAK